MKQDDINGNVQALLRANVANIQVLAAFAVALIETHPNPDALRKQFGFHYETLHAGWLNQPLAEDFLNEAAALRRTLDSAFDRPRQG